MKILVTAGNTAVPIDQVREITNIFTGRTGLGVALEAHRRGHDVTLLTSHPETVGTAPSSKLQAPGSGHLERGAWSLEPSPSLVVGRWSLVVYHTFDELMAAMETLIREKPPDAVVHSAAVSDFQVAGVYAPAPGTRAKASTGSVMWESADGAPRLVSVAAGKVKSDAPELWLRLTPAPKIIDRIRADWGYRGILVKFKLEVGVDEVQLIEVAEASRRHSHADLMVANTRETVREWAYLGPTPDGYRRVPRAELPAQLLGLIDGLLKDDFTTETRRHGVKHRE